MKLKFVADAYEDSWYERRNLTIPVGDDSRLFVSRLREWFFKWVFK